MCIYTYIYVYLSLSNSLSLSVSKLESPFLVQANTTEPQCYSNNTASVVRAKFEQHSEYCPCGVYIHKYMYIYTDVHIQIWLNLTVVDTTQRASSMRQCRGLFAW